ncbi:MAG TPA: hypothetical protein VK639_14180, partial [Terriglobales bacterium]|nr:hypothetical protein [Terriglobales bacterium]
MITTEVEDVVIHCLTAAKEIERLREFWQRANRHPDVDIDFYSLFVASRADTSEPYVVVATQDGQPRAILVGRLEDATIPIRVGYFALTRINVRQLTFLHEGLLRDCNVEIVQAIIVQILSRLREGIADRAVFYNLEVNTELYRFAKTAPSIWLRDHSNEFTERWRTTLPATIDEFLKRRSKKHRYWLRRIGRVFEEEQRGKVRYGFYHQKCEVGCF